MPFLITPQNRSIKTQPAGKIYLLSILAFLRKIHQQPFQNHGRGKKKIRNATAQKIASVE